MIVTGLWSTPAGKRFTTRRRTNRSPTARLPSPPRSVPVLIGGGHGKRRTPDSPRAAPTSSTCRSRQDDTCAVRPGPRGLRAGRPTRPERPGQRLVVCVGATDEAEVDQRAQAIGPHDELRENGVAGTPEETVEKIRRYGALGAERIYLQFLDRPTSTTSAGRPRKIMHV